MRHYAWFTALGCAVVSVLSSCFVGSFDKVDGFDAGGGPGSGAASSSGTAGGSQGGAGGGADCSEMVCTAGEGEAACCFDDPSEGGVCGITVDDYPVDDACLPPGINGAPDAACPTVTIEGRTLAGCCIGSIGLCGVHDTDHEALGCVPGEAVGLEPKQCGLPACSTLCLSALATECLLDAVLPVFECSIRCAVDSVGCEDELGVAIGCIGTGLDRCTDAGYSINEGCEPEHAGLEACWETDDCDAYCAGIFAACSTDQYETEDQCFAMCGVLQGLDDIRESGDDTLNCRMEQILGAASDALLCPAAGPAGETIEGGLCGTACQSFCILDKLVCPDEFDATFDNFLDCEGECTTTFPESSTPYSTAGTGDGSAECRLLHVVRAADPSSGDHSANCGVANDGSASCQ